MRKIICFAAFMAALVLSGCGNQAGNTNSVDVNEAVTGENQSVETAEVSDSELSSKIKRVNAQAAIEQSLNQGMKMLKVELPITDRDDLAEEFFEDVEDIVEDCNLPQNTDYSYFYFSTSKDGNVLISVAFKNENGDFALESVNGIAEEYKNAAAIAADVSDIFK